MLTVQMVNYTSGVKLIEAKQTYIVKWSFHNPTSFMAATIGSNEEEAIADIVQTFGEAPMFKIEDVHLATEAELNDLAGEAALPIEHNNKLLN